MTAQRLVALAVIVVCLAAMAGVLVLGRPSTDETRDQIKTEWRAANGEGAPRPWGSDRGSSAPLSLGALAVGLAAIGLLFAVVSAVVGPAMNAPARSGTSTECGDGRPPDANGVCH